MIGFNADTEKNISNTFYGEPDVLRIVDQYNILTYCKKTNPTLNDGPSFLKKLAKLLALTNPTEIDFITQYKCSYFYDIYYDFLAHIQSVIQTENEGLELADQFNEEHLVNVIPYFIHLPRKNYKGSINHSDINDIKNDAKNHIANIIGALEYLSRVIRENTYIYAPIKYKFYKNPRGLSIHGRYWLKGKGENCKCLLVDGSLNGIGLDLTLGVELEGEIRDIFDNLFGLAAFGIRRTIYDDKGKKVLELNYSDYNYDVIGIKELELIIKIIDSWQQKDVYFFEPKKKKNRR